MTISCKDGYSLFQDKVLNQTIIKHVSKGIATVTMSIRAESVEVSPNSGKDYIGWTNIDVEGALAWRGDSVGSGRWDSPLDSGPHCGSENTQ